MEVSSLPERSTTVFSGRTVLIVTAWTAVLLGTLVPIVLAEELFGTEPAWVVPAQVVVLLGFLALTFLDRFRPLLPFALALLAAKGMFHTSVRWLTVVGITDPPGMWFTVASELLQSTFAVALLVVLLAAGASTERLFLRAGRPGALVEREWVPGFRRERPWWKVALLWGGIPASILIGVNTFAGNFPFEESLGTLAIAIPLVGVAAVLNAFQEEIVYRAAPLAGLVDAVGERHALVLLGAFFGLSHYYGSPGGLVGVAMTGFFGWLLAKSILETRGLAVAFAIHVVADVLVMLTYV